MITATLTGLIFIITGLITSKFPPKSINTIYGYRTKNSMKSQEHWNFAQKYSSLEMIKLGCSLLCMPLLLKFINLGKYTEIVALLFMLIGVVVFIIRIEKAIKKHFPEKSE